MQHRRIPNRPGRAERPSPGAAGRRRLLHAGAAGLLGLALRPRPATAAVTLNTLQVQRADGALLVEFSVQAQLPRAVEGALQRGVPIYFTAQATLWRSRWYWRDERIARVGRSWRVVYQPLTNNWRVGLGGLNQTHATLAEALATVTRAARWRLAELTQLEPDNAYTVEFSWRLDTSQLPSPMAIGLPGGNEFALGVERTLPLE